MKKKNWYRNWFQAAFFALTNGYYKGFTTGKIYTGAGKVLCFPGLNCYSCPSALLSCPIGSLQAVLDSQKFVFSCYVFGFLMLFGSLFGRLICGFMCPFGLIQDLLYKIPVRHKRKNLPGHKYLRHIRWVILILFVIILPSMVVNIAGMGSPWFCEYICPSGTVLGGIPLVLLNPSLRMALGWRYIWKVALLVMFLVLSVFYYRPFCKYICPLGLIYGLFNQVSFYRFKVDREKCTGCGMCQKVCGMDIKVWENPNSSDCIRCGDCKAACPKEAITSSFERIDAKVRAKCIAPEGEDKKLSSGAVKIVLSLLLIVYSVVILRYYLSDSEETANSVLVAQYYGTFPSMITDMAAIMMTLISLCMAAIEIRCRTDTSHDGMIRQLFCITRTLAIAAITVTILGGLIDSSNLFTALVFGGLAFVLLLLMYLIVIYNKKTAA